jgi:Cd2+/Zn2+-exporting ATPase
MRRAFLLEGLDCAHCAAKIEQTIRKSPGIQHAHLNFITRTLSVETDDNEIHATVKGVISEIEPGVTVKERPSVSTDSLREQIRESLLHVRMNSLRLTIGTIVFIGSFIPVFSEQAVLLWRLAAYVIIGYPVILATIKKATKKNLFNEYFLMTLATIGAFLIDQSAEAVGVMVFFELGELLRNLAVTRTRARIYGLLDKKQEYVTVLINGSLSSRKPEEVHVGDLFIVNPGERILLDGKIEEGEALIDTSSLTGESLPKEYSAGDEVLSGFVNTDGVLHIRSIRPYEQSAAVQMLYMIEEASLKKSKNERWIARFASIYTPVVVLCAMAVAFLPPLLFHLPFETWLYRALVLLVISCPCALVLSIPLVSFIAVGKLSKLGILVKGSDDFQTIDRAKAVVFDKTGTLTTGVLKLETVYAFAPYTDKELLAIAAVGEIHSSHPIALALREYYPKSLDKTTVTDRRELAGYGVVYKKDHHEILLGNRKLFVSRSVPLKEETMIGGDVTALYLAVDGVHVGSITFSDTLREDSRQLIAYLHKRGIEPYLLSGDRERPTQDIASKLGIEKYHAGLTPQQKIEHFENIRKQCGISLFVGDGINDAPVLRRADVGIAMGYRSTHLTLESADIVITADAIQKVQTLFSFTDKSSRIIWENIIFILGIKILFLFLGGLGLSSLWEAVFADVGVMLLCLLNTFRLL